MWRLVNYTTEFKTKEDESSKKLENGMYYYIHLLAKNILIPPGIVDYLDFTDDPEDIEKPVGKMYIRWGWKDIRFDNYRLVVMIEGNSVHYEFINTIKNIHDFKSAWGSPNHRLWHIKN